MIFAPWEGNFGLKNDLQLPGKRSSETVSIQNSSSQHFAFCCFPKQGGKAELSGTRLTTAGDVLDRLKSSNFADGNQLLLTTYRVLSEPQSQSVLDACDRCLNSHGKKRLLVKASKHFKRY